MTALEGLKYISEKMDSLDEPIFILRARDMLAYKTVLYWAEQAEGHGLGEQKVCDAIKVSYEMRTWKPTRLPD